MTVRAEAEVFRRIPLFAGCEAAHLQVIAFASERAEFKAGEALIKKGDRGGAGFLVLRGAARVFATNSARAQPVAIVEPGAFVGELGMIAGLPYTVSVIASAPLGAARIPRALFLRVVEEFPEFGAAVYAAMARRLDGSIAELKTIKAAFDQGRSFARRSER